MSLTSIDFFSIGIAYAGSQREDIRELLLPAISDTSVSLEIAAISALALGFVFVGTCDGDVTMAVLQTMMEREESELSDKWGRFLALGLALLYLGMLLRRSYLLFNDSRLTLLMNSIRPTRSFRRDDRNFESGRSTSRKGFSRSRRHVLLRWNRKRTQDSICPSPVYRSHRCGEGERSSPSDRSDWNRLDCDG